MCTAIPPLPNTLSWRGGQFKKAQGQHLYLCHEGVFGEWRYSSTHSLTSALDGGEWSASRSSLYPQGRSPGTHWLLGWVGPRAVLEAVVKRTIPSPRRESNPRTTIIQSVFLTPS
jgi:hypothetical protein